MYREESLRYSAQCWNQCKIFNAVNIVLAFIYDTELNQYEIRRCPVFESSYYPLPSLLLFVHHCSLSLLFIPVFVHTALTCPPNSSYSLCVSSCPETCLGVVGPPGCEEVCVEGCECNPGFILSDDKCVELRDCGCVDPSGTYHPVSGNSLQTIKTIFHLPLKCAKLMLTSFSVLFITSTGETPRDTKTLQYKRN